MFVAESYFVGCILTFDVMALLAQLSGDDRVDLNDFAVLENRSNRIVSTVLDKNNSHTTNEKTSIQYNDSFMLITDIHTLNVADTLTHILDNSTLNYPFLSMNIPNNTHESECTKANNEQDESHGKLLTLLPIIEKQIATLQTHLNALNKQMEAIMMQKERQCAIEKGRASIQNVGEQCTRAASMCKIVRTELRQTYTHIVCTSKCIRKLNRQREVHKILKAIQKARNVEEQLQSLITHDEFNEVVKLYNELVNIYAALPDMPCMTEMRTRMIGIAETLSDSVRKACFRILTHFRATHFDSVVHAMTALNELHMLPQQMRRLLVLAVDDTALDSLVAGAGHGDVECMKKLSYNELCERLLPNTGCTSVLKLCSALCDLLMSTHQMRMHLFTLVCQADENESRKAVFDACIAAIDEQRRFIVQSCEDKMSLLLTAIQPLIATSISLDDRINILRVCHRMHTLLYYFMVNQNVDEKAQISSSSSPFSELLSMLSERVLTDIYVQSSQRLQHLLLNDSWHPLNVPNEFDLGICIRKWSEIPGLCNVTTDFRNGINPFDKLLHNVDVVSGAAPSELLPQLSLSSTKVSNKDISQTTCVSTLSAYDTNSPCEYAELSYASKSLPPQLPHPSHNQRKPVVTQTILFACKFSSKLLAFARELSGCRKHASEILLQFIHKLILGVVKISLRKVSYSYVQDEGHRSIFFPTLQKFLKDNHGLPQPIASSPSSKHMPSRSQSIDLQNNNFVDDTTIKNDVHRTHLIPKHKKPTLSMMRGVAQRLIAVTALLEFIHALVNHYQVIEVGDQIMNDFTSLTMVAGELHALVMHDVIDTIIDEEAIKQHLFLHDWTSSAQHDYLLHAAENIRTILRYLLSQNIASSLLDTLLIRSCQRLQNFIVSEICTLEHPSARARLAFLHSTDEYKQILHDIYANCPLVNTGFLCDFAALLASPDEEQLFSKLPIAHNYDRTVFVALSRFFATNALSSRSLFVRFIDVQQKSKTTASRFT